MVQPVLKTVGQFVLDLEISLPYDLLGFCLNEEMGKYALGKT